MQRRKWMSIAPLRTFCYGVCMGIADIIPGISGGTIAFILGIYESLLKSIGSFDFQAFRLLFSCKFRAFFDRVSGKFLLPLLCGIAFSFIAFAKLFTYLLNHETYRSFLYSTFLGLILGSILYLSKKISLKNAKEYCFLAIGLISAFFLTGTIQSKSGHEPLYSISLSKESMAKVDKTIQEKNIANFQNGRLIEVPESIIPCMYAKKIVHADDIIYNSDDTKVEAYHFRSHSSILDLKVVLCGVIAVSAMLLPGISGSYMLQILGMYGIVLGAVVDLLESLRSRSFDQDAFCIVFSMALGIAIGAVLFSRFVSFLLREYHNQTLCCLLGFMVGALRTVWPFWSYEYVLIPTRLFDGSSLRAVTPVFPEIASLEFVYSAICICLGFLIVLVVDFSAMRKSAIN